MAQAQSIDIPSSITGRLENSLDNDFYRFEVQKPDLFSFGISSLKGFDIMIQILDEKGKTIKTSDDYFKNFGESIANLYLNPGSYYIKVCIGQNDVKIGRPAVIASDSYLLKAAHLSKLYQKPYQEFEKEPNDQFNQAQEIKANKPVTGFFSPIMTFGSRDIKLQKLIGKMSEKSNKNLLNKDVDIYYFEIPEKGSYLLQLDLSAVKDCDSVIAIMGQSYLEYFNMSDTEREESGSRDSGGFLIIDSNSYDKGEGISNYKLKGNTRYYIMIGALSRLDYKPLESVLENSYQLSFKVLPLTSDIEVEPNDSFDTATPINNNITRGFLNSVSDRDHYVLEGDEDHFYKLDFKGEGGTPNPQIREVYKPLNLTLICPENVDLALELYDESQKLLKTIDNNGKGGIEKINDLIINLGTKIYVVVKGGKRNDEGNYKVPYELKLFFGNHDAEAQEYEVNDEVAQNQGANTFTDSIKGYIGNKGDKDNFYAMLPYGKHQFAVKGIPNATLMLEIYDSNGYFIQKSISPKKGADIILEYDAPKQEVFRFLIYAAEKDFFNSETPYFFSIDKGGL